MTKKFNSKQAPKLAKEHSSADTTGMNNKNMIGSKYFISRKNEFSLYIPLIKVL